MRATWKRQRQVLPSTREVLPNHLASSTRYQM
ncbi:Uncharacterised protein [Segatella copri]|nr:Uncharacterised protein [Segatella copri]